MYLRVITLAVLLAVLIAQEQVKGLEIKCGDTTCTRPHSECDFGLERMGRRRFRFGPRFYQFCSCPRNCHGYDPVCGSNKRQYDNECFLRQHSCMSNTNITVETIGYCPGSPCERQNCTRPYSKCLTNFGNAFCRCPMECRDIYDPVCGSDKVTYSCKCDLERAACMRNTDITIQAKGHCPGSPCYNHTCSTPYAKCMAPFGRGFCECVYNCEDSFSPVCGSDGRTYSSKCEMEYSSCRRNEKIEVKSEGECPVTSCREMFCRKRYSRCVLTDGVAKCVCSDESCTNSSSMVCGSDGKTYKNVCELRETICKENKNIFVERREKCPSCDDVTCTRPHAKCRISRGNTECSCSLDCKVDSDPVCGSDDITYRNECFLKSEACRSNTIIVIKSKGRCPVTSCSELFCPKRYSRCVLTDGVAKCVCSDQGCTNSSSMVCGSDGKTYKNVCELRETMCNEDKDMFVARRGKCPSCDNVACTRPHAKCRIFRGNAECSCSLDCKVDSDPVCGSDDITYRNECSLKSEACRSNTIIVIKSKGRCPDQRRRPGF